MLLHSFSEGMGVESTRNLPKVAKLVCAEPGFEPKSPDFKLGIIIIEQKT